MVTDEGDIYVCQPQVVIEIVMSDYLQKDDGSFHELAYYYVNNNLARVGFANEVEKDLRENFPFFGVTYR